MEVYIKNWSLANWEELLKWAKIGANNAMIGEFTEVEEVPPHGDLIDRDALIKDGWLNLYKEVIRMGGYAIHELPLKNPSIPVIIPADDKDTDVPIKEEGET